MLFSSSVVGMALFVFAAQITCPLVPIAHPALVRCCTMLMDQKEECKSIPSKKNMMDNKKKRLEFDEGREPLILMSATNIHHRGLSYPPGCPALVQCCTMLMALLSVFPVQAMFAPSFHCETLHVVKVTAVT